MLNMVAVLDPDAREPLHNGLPPRPLLARVAAPSSNARLRK